MMPDDPRHGTEAGHEQHLRDGEDPCDDCRHGDLLASRRRTKRKAMGHVYTRPLGHMHGRLQELRDQGATLDDIAGWAGLCESEVWRYVNGSPEDLVYARTYLRLRNMQVGPIVTPVGITRRIQALMWLGYSAIVIAREAGTHVDTIRDARDNPRCFLARKVRNGIVDAFDRLHMAHSTGASKQDRAGVTRARNLARRSGWAPPLAWDNIDDPREHPKGIGAPKGREPDDIDPVIVDRLLLGERVQSTRAEKEEAMRRWLADGKSAVSLCRLHGWQEGRYSRDALTIARRRRVLVEAYDETEEVEAS